MLLNLHVKNLALIDNLDVSFQDHLNILTGETGAGKSIIIGSIALALGSRVNKDFVRAGAEYGLVELLFSIEKESTRQALEALEISPTEDGELLISRKIMDNRVINKLNDQTVTVGKLKEVASVLLDLHAQHEQQSLKQSGYQLDIVDRFGKDKISAVKVQVASAYSIYRDIFDKLEEENLSENEQKRTMDLLKYELEEIQAAQLTPGEDEVVQKQYRRMKNSKDIMQDIGQLHSICGYEEHTSAGSMIGTAMSMMERAAGLDEELSGLLSQITDIDALLSDFNRELSDYIDSMQFDGEAFAQLEERLDVINTLKVKYGNSIEAILAYAEKNEEKYNQLLHYSEYIEDLKKQYEVAKDAYLSQAELLHKLRVEYAKLLEKEIHDALVDLNFLDVDFSIAVEKLDTFTKNGSDEVSFMISTNVGEKKRLLSEVASGGELSRIMLAVKSVLADEDEIDTLIFDEIDVGISGRTAQKVSEKLCKIANRHQVISITHLPQIAAMADAHYKIEKQVIDGKTITDIKPLSEDSSVEELARLLGGVEITDTVLMNAKEMKDMAVQSKKY